MEEGLSLSLSASLVVAENAHGVLTHFNADIRYVAKLVCMFTKGLSAQSAKKKPSLTMRMGNKCKYMCSLVWRL